VDQPLELERQLEQQVLLLGSFRKSCNQLVLRRKRSNHIRPCA